MDSERLNELLRRRDAIKLQGRVTPEMVDLQHQIVAEFARTGRVKNLANAWNYLSVLQYKLRDYQDAEASARKALAIYVTEANPSAEVIACYEFVLARILGAQYRFAEAVPIAESGVDHYSVFHAPPDDFLAARQGEAALMRAYMRREAEQPT